MSTKRILILDDEENIGRSLRAILEREGYGVNLCRSVAEFRAHPDAHRADAYLLDMRLPDGNGVDLLKAVRRNGVTAPTLMISGHGTIADAVEAIRAGAFDFLEKPLSRDQVLLAVKNALVLSNLRKEMERLPGRVGRTPKMIGDSPTWQRAVEEASMAARSDARVLLIGESGSGKELLGAHIHDMSAFASGPFVKVNCAAIPTELIETELFGHEKGSFTGAISTRRGKFELADRGTIFLDEVGDLHGASQAKLLRVLQEGEFHRVGGETIIKVKVRVISATNRHLAAMVAQEKFREDLYYRLSVMPIRVPPLRERRSDIRLLVQYFLEDFCERNNFKCKTIDEDLFALLDNYNWPGNARELRNVVERMAILSPGERLTRDSLPVEIRIHRDTRPTSSIQEARESAEREQILRALEETKWNISSAARLLGMERTNLHKRIRALDLCRKE